MRLLAWNVGHQTKRRQMAAEVGQAIASAAPDVIVLNEYVSDASHEPFLGALANAGLKERLVTTYVKGQNQVLLISRHALSRGNVECCDVTPSTRPNWLHATTHDGTNVVGCRIPMMKKPGAGTAYWKWLVYSSLPAMIGSPTVLLGDLNAYAKYTPLKKATAAGWKVATPSEGWSYHGPKGRKTSIDHALVSPHFKVTRAEYVTTLHGVALAGAKGAYSDHAALIIDVERSHS